MSGPRRHGRSRGEVIRERAGAHFVGRRTQLSLFAENLEKDPGSESDPAEFLFHVCGLGGVGKSTLLRQWQETARRSGALTALVDENDVHGIPQTLAELARQLAERAGPLKGFDQAAEQYGRDHEAAAEPAPVEGGPSVSSRLVAQAALGAASLIPGAGVVTTMANPDTAAQGLDRLRATVRGRGGRARTGDVAGLSRAFVAELVRLCGRVRWVVLFLDTWEQTGRYLDGWLRDLLCDTFGPLPLNVMVVLAGRDELAEREWAELRAQLVDVPLEVFTETESRALLAARGVTEPEVVEAVLRLSLGLPLLVELLALARPGASVDVDADGDVVDRAVERFVQWIDDPWQRATVLACALVPQLNEDVFGAAVPPEARELWGWLCGQPFVSGRGDFKQYHAVVRASMVRQQRARSPQRWTEAHLRLAEAHAIWRADIEGGVPSVKRWGDTRWRQHQLDETYHLLCAHPAVQLAPALEQAVHAAGEDTAVLRQWTDVLGQAARDTANADLLSWATRLQGALTDEEPALASLTVLIAQGRLGTAARARAHAYRGRRLYLADRDDEAMTELDRAIAVDPHNARAWGYRGDVHRWHGRIEEAVAELSTALDLDPGDSWALARRGEAHDQAGRYEEAVTDLTAALDLDPGDPWALGSRGQAHQKAGRFDQALADYTAALGLQPVYRWILDSRGEVYRTTGRYDEAVADFDASLGLDPRGSWALARRGDVHRMAGRYEQAFADLTAALDLSPGYAWALASRGEAYRESRRYDEAITDFDAALAVTSSYSWALTRRGETFRESGRYDRAVTDFDAALALDPGDAWTLGSRGQAHHQAGRYDEAITDLNAALTLNPDLVWALCSRGETHRRAGRYHQAVTDLTAALALNPDDPWALVRRGAAQRRMGHYSEAVSDLSAALDLAPGDDWALAIRGEAHRQAGRFDQAITDYTAALARDPDYTWALGQRGVAHRSAGHHAQAAEDFERALAASPDDRGLLFEKTMLSTLTSGPAACREQWTELLASPVRTTETDATRYFELFRVLVLEPHRGVAETTEAFLSGDPDHDAVVDLVLYLTELSDADGELADRARECRRIIGEHTAE